MRGKKPMGAITTGYAKRMAIRGLTALTLSTILTASAWGQQPPPAGMPAPPGAPGGMPPGGMPPGGMPPGGMPPLNRPTSETNFTAAVQVKDGVYLPGKSNPKFVSGGKVENGSASGIHIASKLDKFNGLYVHGNKSTYTVSNATIALSGKGSSDFDGVAAGALVSQDATLILKNVKITTNGVVSTASTVMEAGTLKVYHSTLVANGGPLPSGYVPKIGPGMMEPPTPLRLSGDARTTLTMGNAKSYFYDSTIIADGWGALSTDAAHGVYVEANNCDIRTIKSGYGTYADNGAKVVINNSKMHTATYAGVIAGKAAIDLNNDAIVSGGYAVMIHDVMGSTSEVGTLKIKGGAIASRDAVIFVKCANADITIDRAKLASQNGDLILSVINDDANATRVNGQKVSGINVTLKNAALVGNILHLDTQRTMSVAFNNTTLKGVIEGAGSKWTATANSKVILVGSVAIAAIDAPAGVTIAAVAGKGYTLKGTYKLASGGILTVATK